MSPRLVSVKPHKLTAVLRLNGFQQAPDRGKGSHAYFKHNNDPVRTTTVPDYEEIGAELLGRILKQAGKTREEYFQRLNEV